MTSGQFAAASKQWLQRKMETDIQALIRQVLKEAELEKCLRFFFLSSRPGIIYGSGHLAKHIISFCHIFHKEIACLLVLPDEGCTVVMRHGYAPCYELNNLPENLDTHEHDLLLGLHESRHAEVKKNLAASKAGFAAICDPISWENSIQALKGAKTKLFALYDEYEKTAAGNVAAINKCGCGQSAKKLIIHAGMPKTGTTALQKFLFINRYKLKSLDFYYKTPLMDEEKHKEMLLAYKNIYHEDLSESNHNSILSAEYFIFNNINDFAVFINRFKTRFIIYLRDPLSFAQSYMLHTVRTYPVNTSRPPLPCNRLYEYMSMQLDLLYGFFNGSLPTEDLLTLRPFFPNAAAHWLEKDFCRLAGIDSLAEFTFPEPQNVNLPVDFCFFMAHLCSLPLTEEEFFNIEDELQLIAGRQSNTPSLPAARKFRLFSLRQIENVPINLIRRYTEASRRMGDASFYDRGREAMLRLEQVPYRQLPEDLQYEIFYKLSPQSRNAILRLWPLWRELPRKLRGSAFLPDIPEDEDSAKLISSWAATHYKNMPLK